MTDIEKELSLNRSEKTVLVDAINWYFEYTQDSIFVEELTDEQKTNLKNIKSELNKNGTCNIKNEMGSLIIEDILPEFGQELKEQIGLPEVTNKQKTGDFYREQLEGINKKIKQLKRQQNPFF